MFASLALCSVRLASRAGDCVRASGRHSGRSRQRALTVRFFYRATVQQQDSDKCYNKAPSMRNSSVVSARKSCELVLLVCYITLATFFGPVFFTAEQQEKHQRSQPDRQRCASALPNRPASDRCQRDARRAAHKNVLYLKLLLEPAQAPRFDTRAGRQQRHPKEKHQAHERRASFSIQRQSLSRVRRL